MRSGFKPYAIDNGLRNRVAFAFSEDTGWQVENVIACFLRQQYEEVYFSKNGNEIDFIVKEGMHISHRIQVWYDDISVREIPSRELAGFTIPLQGDDTPESILLTNDYEDVIEHDGVPIRCIPVVKYLLSL
jgi:Predicted ATPase (AAA+ superfamily)